MYYSISINIYVMCLLYVSYKKQNYFNLNFFFKGKLNLMFKYIKGKRYKLFGDKVSRQQ